MPGRKMKGYATLANALTRDRKELAKWMGRALEYAGGLPAKTKKAAKPSALADNTSSISTATIGTLPV